MAAFPLAQGYDVGGRPLYIPHFPLHRDPDFWYVPWRRRTSAAIVYAPLCMCPQLPCACRGPDACEFRPERWQDTAYVASRHPYCYQPFSKGPRDCIGQTFAVLVSPSRCACACARVGALVGAHALARILQEAKTLLAMLYFRFTFKHVGLEEYQAYRITSTPAHGVRVMVHTRNKGA